MATAVQVSIGEYLATTYHPDRDYVDGVLVERHVGEREHSRLQSRLLQYLMNREQEWSIDAVVEQRVQVAPSRFRIPDVCVVVDRSAIEPIYRKPPFLCVEILSKDDRWRDMQERIDDYLRFGVPNVWVIDPPTRRAWICRAVKTEEVLDGVLRTESPALAVPLAALFDEPPRNPE